MGESFESSSGASWVSPPFRLRSPFSRLIHMRVYRDSPLLDASILDRKRGPDVE